MSYKGWISGLIIFLNIAVLGCQSNKTDATKSVISLNSDSSKIVLSGVQISIIESLRTASLRETDWQNLFPVYKGLSEDPSKQISGKYQINSDNSIIFSPDSAFVKKDSYCAFFYYPSYLSIKDVLSHKTMPGKVTVIEGYFEL